MAFMLLKKNLPKWAAQYFFISRVILITTLIIMLGVTGYVTLQSTYMQSDSKINLRSVALQLAQQKLERTVCRFELVAQVLQLLDAVHDPLRILR